MSRCNCEQPLKVLDKVADIKELWGSIIYDESLTDVLTIVPSVYYKIDRLLKEVDKDAT